MQFFSDGFFGDQKGSSDGAEDAFVLHFLYLVSGQALSPFFL